ncbi:PSH1 [Candida pseudojiufengensis]|uniref:PSH1 n=1 Tax=Candida pseudojiufengensis TaxID=497109 RepID=UPI0022252104|nr:PSH1 [Candida pseudojiufengensis]KAI5960438.1 PSH1 [Candida pseudojiufengensis]
MNDLIPNTISWNQLDTALTSNLLSKITNSIECSICSEVMIAPMTAECGHTFCYDCLHQWFKNKINCPTCRHKIKYKPTLNLQLDEICKNMIEIIIDSKLDSSLQKRQIEGYATYESHSKDKSIFGELFHNYTFTMLDNSDGVPRCGNCNWEAHGTVCLHCGCRFRNSDDEDGDSSEDEDDDDDDEDDEFYQDVRGIAEGNHYDSDDSFIDSRTAEEIWLEMNDNGDEHDDSDQFNFHEDDDDEDDDENNNENRPITIWTSDSNGENDDEDSNEENQYSDWDGFESARHSNTRSHVIYISDTDEELQVRNDIYSDDDNESQNMHGDDSFSRLQINDDSGNEDHDESRDIESQGYDEDSDNESNDLADALTEFHNEDVEHFEDDDDFDDDGIDYNAENYFDNDDDVGVEDDDGAGYDDGGVDDDDGFDDDNDDDDNDDYW